MLFLPDQSSKMRGGLEKVNSYLLLANIGCPVFKSAIIEANDIINQSLISALLSYFKTTKVTVRYQYVVPNKKPIQGGNRYPLTLDDIYPLQVDGTLLWILEPINRLKNDYGINLYFQNDICNIEIVGKGFDVSDLNRGQITPHQIITLELPIRYGNYNEWWKFLKFNFISQQEYNKSKALRLKKLVNMNYNVSANIFNDTYSPLPFEKLEELLKYISLMHEYVQNNIFCVSCSINNGHFIFWDIQTPLGKEKIYGVR